MKFRINQKVKARKKSGVVVGRIEMKDCEDKYLVETQDKIVAKYRESELSSSETPKKSQSSKKKSVIEEVE